MDGKTTSTRQFEEAIKNFTKLSLEADALLKAGNVDAHKLMNKSLENRSEAIAYEASKRNKSVEEVKLEFDKRVDEEKKLLRGESVNNRVETKKSENADGKDTDDESEIGSDENSDEGSSGTETSEDTSEDEDEDDDDDDEDEDDENSSGNVSDDEKTDDEVKSDETSGDDKSKA